MKDLKAKYPEAAEEDEFFKSLYARLRKYNKKVKRINEIEEKVKAGNSLTEEQQDLFNKKEGFELMLDETASLTSDYLKKFQSFCSAKYGKKKKEAKEVKEEEKKVEEPEAALPKEEVKQEEPVEKPEPPVEQPPAVDLELQKQEELKAAFEQGRLHGYEQGRSDALLQGRDEGYNQAKNAFEDKAQSMSEEEIKRTANYCSFYLIIGQWIDNFMMQLDPIFNRNDYFTDEEAYGIKQLYFQHSMIGQQINFNLLVDALSSKIRKLVNRENELIPNCRALTYKQLSEAIDNALQNPKFIETTHQCASLGGNEMMGFGGYPYPMMGFSPSQMMNPALNPQKFVQPQPVQIPVQAPAPVISETKPAESVPESTKTENVVHEEVPTEAVQMEDLVQTQANEIVQVTFDEPSQQAADKVHDVFKDHIWNNPDDDDNSDDSNDDDNYDDNSQDDSHPSEAKEEGLKEGEQPAAQPPATEENKLAGEGGKDWRDEEQSAANRRGRQRGYQNRGYGGYQSRGYYDKGYYDKGYYDKGYQDKTYQDKAYPAKGYSGKGYHQDKGYYAEYDERDYQDESYQGGSRRSRPYDRGAGPSRGGRRGGRYRDDKRGGDQARGNYKKKKFDEPQPKIDDDGFFIVKK